MGKTKLKVKFTIPQRRHSTLHVNPKKQKTCVPAKVILESSKINLEVLVLGAGRKDIADARVRKEKKDKREKTHTDSVRSIRRVTKDIWGTGSRLQAQSPAQGDFSPCSRELASQRGVTKICLLPKMRLGTWDSQQTLTQNGKDTQKELISSSSQTFVLLVKRGPQLVERVYFWLLCVVFGNRKCCYPPAATQRRRNI